MVRRQRDESIAPAGKQWIGLNDKRPSSPLKQAYESRIEVAFAAGAQDMHLKAEGVRCGVHFFCFCLGLLGIARIDEQSDRCRCRHRFVQ
jgi:hypothetical protein